MTDDERVAGVRSSEIADPMRRLIEQPVSPLPAASAVEMRRRAVDAIEVRLADLRAARDGRSKRRVVVALVLAAAVSAAATWLLVLGSPHEAAPAAAEVTGLAGAVEMVRAGRVTALPRATLSPLGQEDELRTGESGLARAALASGATVQIGSRARVRFRSSKERIKDELDDRVDLMAGRVDVDVPKLPEGASLSVKTEDATVIVHGTRFSVERSGESGATRVEVVQGRVQVLGLHGERMLGPGDSWSSAEPMPSSEPPQNDDAARESADVHPQAPLVDAGKSPSALGAQNALLVQAMRARATGHPAKTITKLDRFLVLYPDSPLLEAVRVERLYALYQLGDREAELRREAERYLARYPNGFAREEVRRMLETSKGGTP